MNVRPLPNSLAARDVLYQLHPYTNLRRHERQGPIVIERGDGVRVWDSDGREYIEAMAGLWSVALGFGEKRLVAAATRQMEKLPYYHSFSHKANEPSVLLAEKLSQMAPVRDGHVFFCNSGSEANDTVVKMVWFFNNARGQPQKKTFVARNGGYHGITIASGSLTGLQANHKGFDLPLPFVRHLTCPHHYRYAEAGESEEAFATRLAGEFEALVVAEGPETIAAFIGEPLPGAGGVLVPPATYWEKMQAVCRKYDILVVADEVINGFGRTGRAFACETFAITPDILVLSKQLTSSYMPLAAVVVADAVYQGIADGSEALGTFGHGYTASAHPVATAVGLENLAILEERGLLGGAPGPARRLQEGLRRFASHPLVGEVRGTGMIAAVELVRDKATKATFEPAGKVGLHLFERAHEHGLIVRAVRDSIAFCPPMIATEADMDAIVERFGRALDDTAAWIAAGMPA
jgi:4-aminobutyrate--pyruvate transaminase